MLLMLMNSLKNGLLRIYVKKLKYKLKIEI